MKANAPEKIYVCIPDDDIVGTASTQKGFPHQFVTEEYHRIDAFIEKACEFLSKLSNYNEGFIYPSHSGVIDSFVNNFKNYMKGE